MSNGASTANCSRCVGVRFTQRRRDFERVLQERATSVEKAIAEQRTVEKNNIELRERQTSATDAFNQVQAEYYGVGADISRLETRY